MSYRKVIRVGSARGIVYLNSVTGDWHTAYGKFYSQIHQLYWPSAKLLKSKKAIRWEYIIWNNNICYYFTVRSKREPKQGVRLANTVHKAIHELLERKAKHMLRVPSGFMKCIR